MGRELTTREAAIIKLVSQGDRNKDIAQTLNISEYMVKNNISTIYDKLGLDNRVELALWYVAKERIN
jgi:DNA-binding NarL/FixJ family response regulator